MSYTPTQWKAGDTVTSAKLNKMEQGIAGGANILIAQIIETTQEADDGGSSGPELRSASTSTDSVPTARLDKTAREILDADFTFITGEYTAGMITYRDFAYVAGISQNLETGAYQFAVFMGTDGELNSFIAETEDDYPELMPFDGGTPIDDSGNTPIAT